MKELMIFNLTRPAKKSGGDRYEYGEQGEPDFMTLYVPQRISRKDGSPYTHLAVLITNQIQPPVDTE